MEIGEIVGRFVRLPAKKAFAGSALPAGMSVGMPVILVLGAFLLSGCGKTFRADLAADSVRNPQYLPDTTHPKTPQKNRTGTGGRNASIAAAPAYRAAVASYARKEYQSALAQLQVLRTSKTLTPADDAFLKRQIALCEQAISSKAAPQSTASQSTASAVIPARTGKKSGKAENADCGPRALLLIAKQEMPNRTLPTLASLRTIAGTTPAGTNLEGLVKAAKEVGLKAEGVQMDKDALSRLSTPALAFVDGNHFVAVLAIHDRHNSIIGGEDSATIHDPNNSGKEEVTLARLLARSGGILLKLTPEKQTARSVPAESNASGT